MWCIHETDVITLLRHWLIMTTLVQCYYFLNSQLTIQLLCLFLSVIFHRVSVHQQMTSAVFDRRQVYAVDAQKRELIAAHCNRNASNQACTHSITSTFRSTTNFLCCNINAEHHSTCYKALRNKCCKLFTLSHCIWHLIHTRDTTEFSRLNFL